MNASGDQSGIAGVVQRSSGTSEQDPLGEQSHSDNGVTDHSAPGAMQQPEPPVFAVPPPKPMPMPPPGIKRPPPPKFNAPAPVARTDQQKDGEQLLVSLLMAWHIFSQQ